MEHPLSPHDSAIWRTVWLNDLADAGLLKTAESIPTSFAPHLGVGERALAAGPVRQLEYMAAGDGSYTHESGGALFVTGSPRMLAASAGFTLAGAALRGRGNAKRRREAEQRAQQQWRQIDEGLLYVSQFGLYFHTPGGLFPWSWDSITSMQLVGPGQLLMSGHSQRGPVQWILQSDWAELAFTFWARSRHPEHPQFRSGTWVPPGWVQRVEASPWELPRLLGTHWRHLLPPPA